MIDDEDNANSAYAEIVRKHADWLAPDNGSGSFPFFGFEVGPGWVGLLGKLFDDIAAIVRPTGDKFEVRQIKEKFGTLRFYWGGPFDDQGHDRIREAVELAEFRSAATCELCGARGWLRNSGGWYAVRCDEHAARKSKKVGTRIGHLTGHLGKSEYSQVDYDPDTDTVTRKSLTRAEYEALTRSTTDD